ncbi:TetR/AcrR family transcriptional regulator [Nonomuraea sp. NPDC050680]|uniref:TetR/AcrR family transcriptional regulator n=1 Tax=Nonomuraea sp. NPDC050680 TaxID=3154630 RepID=UPI0033DE43C2
MPSTSRTFIEEARRAQMIDCAIDAIATLGYAQTSMAQIAKRAGIAPGSISYHFGSKDELIQAVVTEVAKLATEMMEPAIVAQSTATDALRVYLETNLAFMRLHRKPLLALVEIITHARGGTDTSSPYTAQHEIALKDIEKVLVWGQKTGEFREFDLRSMAIAIRGAVDAVPAQLFMNPDLDLGLLATELTTLFTIATRRQP